MKLLRLLALLLILTMLLSCVSVFAQDDAVNPKGVFPIVKEGNDITLSIFVATPILVTTFDAPTNLYTQWLMDQTGLKFKFVTTSVADEETKLSLLLNTNDYPDIILSNTIDSNTAALYAADGVFIPLDDLYKEYADELVKMYDEYPFAWNIGQDYEGNLIGISNINDCLHCNVSDGRAWYFHPFMAKYIEETEKNVPASTAEYKDYLTWVRDTDVNGNGDISDEIPLATYADALPSFRRWAANMFLPYPQDGYAVIDGKVEAQFTKDAFRDCIKYLHSLYAEKLLLAESFSITQDELIRIGEAEQPILASFATEWSNNATEKFGQSERYFYSFVLPTLSSESFEGYTYQRGSINPVYNYAYITDKCENPAAALRLLDFMKSFEGTMNGYIGPKGVCWDDPDEGALGLNGEPARYKLLVNYGIQPGNAGWNQKNSDYRSASFRLGEQATGIELIKQFLDTGDAEILQQVKGLAAYNEGVNYFQAIQEHDKLLPQEYILPTMLLNEQDTIDVADVKASMNPYFDLAFVEFITGKRDINSDAVWQQFIDELHNMGLQKILDIYTAAL